MHLCYSFSWKCWNGKEFLPVQQKFFFILRIDFTVRKCFSCLH